MKLLSYAQVRRLLLGYGLTDHPLSLETGGAGPQGTEHQGAASAGASLPKETFGAAVSAECRASAH